MNNYVAFAIEQLAAKDLVATAQAIEACVRNSVSAYMIAQLRGRACMMQYDWLSAYDHFQYSLTIQPDGDGDQMQDLCSELHTRWALAKACYELGLYEEGAAHCRRGIVIYPDAAELWMELGAAYASLQCWPELLTCAERAVALAPNNADCHHCLGAALHAFGEDYGAIIQFKKAMELAPEPRIEVALAAVLLRTGQWEEGFKHFEARWGLPTPIAPWWFKGAEPLYSGDLDGLRNKRILLRAEQGFGDSIMFARYVPMIKELASYLILEVQPGLEKLFKSLPADEIRVTRVTERLQQVVPLPDSELPEYDVQTTLMSLPFLFGTTPATVPPAPVFTRSVRPGQGKVGICWQGGPRRDEPSANAVDQRRSIPKEMLKPITDVCSWRSLQKEDLDTKDFLETAEIINGLDLVITVDTAIAHLSASLGVDTWMLDRFDHCWRWTAGRTDTVWYPSMRIFRQPRLGDWGPAIRKVAQEVKARYK